MATSSEIQKRVSQLAEKWFGAQNIVTLVIIAFKRSESISFTALYGYRYQNFLMRDLTSNTNFTTKPVPRDCVFDDPRSCLRGYITIGRACQVLSDLGASISTWLPAPTLLRPSLPISAFPAHQISTFPSRIHQYLYPEKRKTPKSLSLIRKCCQDNR